MDTTLALWRRATAEGLAAFALVVAGCGAIIANQKYGGALGAVGVSLVFGLIIMVMIYATGHLSGAHINPAVTIAFTLTRHFSPRDAVAYITAQLAGASTGALLLLAVWTDKRRHRAIRRGRQRVRLRDRAERIPDVRDHLRRD
jgi:glycerol uptake facilitator-like aquaporin